MQSEVLVAFNKTGLSSHKDLLGLLGDTMIQRWDILLFCSLEDICNVTNCVYKEYMVRG